MHSEWSSLNATVFLNNMPRTLQHIFCMYYVANAHSVHSPRRSCSLILAASHVHTNADCVLGGANPHPAARAIFMRSECVCLSARAYDKPLSMRRHISMRPLSVAHRCVKILKRVCGLHTCLHINDEGPTRDRSNATTAAAPDSCSLYRTWQ